LVQYTSDLPNPKKSVRSIIAREKKSLRTIKHTAEQFLKRAPTFQVDLDLDELTNSISDIKLQEDVCDKELGADQPAQVFSGQWVDKKGKKIAFYLAERWAGEPVQSEVGKFYLYL